MNQSFLICQYAVPCSLPSKGQNFGRESREWRHWRWKRIKEEVSYDRPTACLLLWITHTEVERVRERERERERERKLIKWSCQDEFFGYNYVNMYFWAETSLGTVAWLVGAWCRLWLVHDDSVKEMDSIWVPRTHVHQSEIKSVSFWIEFEDIRLYWNRGHGMKSFLSFLW